VNNSTLVPNQNPFRGKKKTLSVQYSLDGGEKVLLQRQEKDWLIIGPVEKSGGSVLLSNEHETTLDGETSQLWAGMADKIAVSQTAKASNAAVAAVSKLASPESKRAMNGEVRIDIKVDNNVPAQIQEVRRLVAPQTAPALNDYLIRRFSISPQRLRGPMPIEVPTFHRNDLAQLFAELGFKRGAEIGVAEGNYSEVLLKANPECELLLVDPWHHYSDNPQGKSPDKHAFAFNETTRKTKGYKGAKMIASYSMDAVRDVDDNSLDFCYVDAHHSYPYVMCDIIEWTKRVRSGGIFALDDIYKLNEKWGAGPMEAIYDYTRAMRINPWWLISAHKSVDAFFVKP
jgi:hypothetical protein